MRTRIRTGMGPVMTMGVCALAVACGGGSTAPSVPPTATNLITITAAGVNPKSIVVARGSQVTFVNNDSRAHEMQSDPHPDHNDCPELEQVGGLKPGETRISGNLNISRTCGFHDHDDALNKALQGSIVIQ